MWMRWVREKNLIKRLSSGRFCLPSYVNLATSQVLPSKTLDNSSEVDEVYQFLQTKDEGFIDSLDKPCIFFRKDTTVSPQNIMDGVKTKQEIKQRNDSAVSGSFFRL